MKGVGEVQREDQSKLPEVTNEAPTGPAPDVDLTDQQPARQIIGETTSGDRKGRVVLFTSVGDRRTCIELKVDFGPDEVVDNIETDLRKLRDFIENGPDASGKIGELSASTPGGMPLEGSADEDSEAREANSSNNDHRGVLSASTPGGMPLTDDEAEPDDGPKRGTGILRTPGLEARDPWSYVRPDRQRSPCVDGRDEDISCYCDRTAVVVQDPENETNVGEARSSPRRSLRQFATLLARRLTDHHTLLLANGVAFSAVLGLIPALVAIVSVYGLVASPADVESNMRPLTSVLPADAADLIVNQLRNVTAISSSQVTVGLIGGLVGVLWAISSAVNAVVVAIRVAHEIASPHSWIRGRLFALKLSTIAILATATSIWLVAALPAQFGRFSLTNEVVRAIQVARFPTVIGISALSIAVLYRAVVGHRSGRYAFVTVGAVSGTMIWVASTIGLSLFYNSAGQLDSTFGSLGAVAALMAWFYLSAVAVLVGAEVDSLRHAMGPTGTASQPDQPNATASRSAQETMSLPMTGT